MGSFINMGRVPEQQGQTSTPESFFPAMGIIPPCHRDKDVLQGQEATTWFQDYPCQAKGSIRPSMFFLAWQHQLSINIRQLYITFFFWDRVVSKLKTINS